MTSAVLLLAAAQNSSNEPRWLALAFGGLLFLFWLAFVYMIVFKMIIDPSASNYPGFARGAGIGMLGGILFLISGAMGWPEEWSIVGWIAIELGLA